MCLCGHCSCRLEMMDPSEARVIDRYGLLGTKLRSSRRKLYTFNH